MATEQPQSGSASPFWALYLQEHDRTLNRWLHVAGTLASWILLATAVCFRLWWLIPVAPVAGYGPAWLGHALVERNRPLSIRYPLQSLLADYRLTLLMISGRDPGRVPPKRTASTSRETQHPSKDAE